MSSGLLAKINESKVHESRTPDAAAAREEFTEAAKKKGQFSIFAKRNKLPECLTQAEDASALLKAQESRRLGLLRLCPDKRVKCYLLKLPFFGLEFERR